MSMESQTTAITKRYNDDAPVVAANICWDLVAAPHGTDEGPFEAPDINLASPSAAIWQRLLIRTVGRAAPFGIGENAQTIRRGLIVIQTFYPRFTSAQDGVQKLETAALLFHRAHISNVHCEDMDGPEWIELPDWPNFKGVEAAIPFYVLDPASTYVEDTYTAF